MVSFLFSSLDTDLLHSGSYVELFLRCLQFIAVLVVPMLMLELFAKAVTVGTSWPRIEGLLPTWLRLFLAPLVGGLRFIISSSVDFLFSIYSNIAVSASQTILGGEPTGHEVHEPETTSEVSTQTGAGSIGTVEDTERSKQLEEEDLTVVQNVLDDKTPLHSLERTLHDPARAVKIRRVVIGRICRDCFLILLTIDLVEEMMKKENCDLGGVQTSRSLANLPYTNLDYSMVNGSCCENVIGYDGKVMPCHR